MKVMCITTKYSPIDSELEYESLGISVGTYYEVFLASSSCEFSEKLNDHVHKSSFLVYNDEKKWVEYKSCLFAPSK